MSKRICILGAACLVAGAVSGCASQASPPPTITVTAAAPTPSATSIYDQAEVRASEACEAIAQYNSTIGMGSPETIPGMKAWLPQARSLLQSAAAGDPQYEEMSSSVEFLYYAVPDWEPSGNYPTGSKKSNEMFLNMRSIMDAFENLVTSCADNFR